MFLIISVDTWRGRESETGREGEKDKEREITKKSSGERVKERLKTEWERER